MGPLRWNHDKNETLKLECGISFDEMVLAIEAGGLVGTASHPNAERYPNRPIAAVALERYVYLVPPVEAGGYCCLQTIIPGRKATRDFLLNRGRS